jgi:O-acetyl-ADP-ribose deacetylase
MNVVLRERKISGGCILQLAQGDITAEPVDAIVNAANSRLQHGGGVALSISKHGGAAIQKESDAWVKAHGSVSNDEPAYTSGGDLPCKYVIHAVGPVWGEGDEDNKLAAAVAGSLRRGDELKLTSIAFPAISTGIFGFPKERAARVILEAIESYFVKNAASSLQLVKMMIFDRPTLDAFLSVWNDRFPIS